VFELLQARAEGASPETRAEIAVRSRWLLAEKLAETEEAWDFYRQLHAASPEDTEVLEALARIAGARGETALAAEYLEGLSARTRVPRDGARYQRRMAEVLEHAGDIDGARAALTRALDILPDDQDALGGLRRLAEAANDWQGVVGVLARQAALSTGRTQVDRFAEIARLWEEKLSDRAVAADAWRKVLDLAPEDAEALERLVALAEESGDWPGFVEHGQALLRTREGAERSALMRRIGAAFATHLRREEEAVRFLDGASSGKSPDIAAARLLERIYMTRGEWDRVVDALLRIAHASTDDAERADALAGAARIRAETLRDRAGAAEIYDELLRIAPDRAEALRYRAEFLYEAGRFADAVTLFERMESGESARDVDDFDAQVEVAMYFFRFAEALRRLGRPADAVLRYERALALNPTHLPSLEAIGPMYMAVSEWTKADKVWKQLLQLTGGHGNPEQLSRIYASLGTVEHQLGQPDKARKRFTKALELKPNDIPALRGYGAVLFSAGDWNNLLNIFNNIIYHTQDPADVIDAYLNKGFVLDARLGLPEKAAQHYEKSLAFDPGQPLALLRLAELALRRQDWPEAASLAERGLQIQDETPGVRSFLFLVRSIAYQACGDGPAAMDGFKSAMAADVKLDDLLAGATIEDYEKVHELLRARLQASQRI
jgi:tetratricopeptide (TPR) repeat protein